MQGRARFIWRQTSGHSGECSAARWLAARSARVSGWVFPPAPALPQKPKTRRRSSSARQLAPQNPKDWLEGFCPEPSQEELIAVNSKGLMLSVRLADIGWMEAAENSVKLHVGKHTHRLRDTLAAVAAKLPPGRFLRISRSTLVNIEQIKGLQQMFFDEYEVLLRNGTRLPLARACYANLQQIGWSLPIAPPPLICSRLAQGRPASNC